MNQTIFQFPKDFLWGAATSSHQVEGNNIDNDWWQWEQEGKVKDKSGIACDQWNLFREDFKLAKSLHHNAHRFSVEWSRIEPEEGKFNEEAIRHYREVLEALWANQLEPVVTLYHFTLPLWLAQEGGWQSKRAPELFARYCKKVFQSLGGKVRYWMTINEPEIYIYKSYLTGEWPPGEKSYNFVYPLMINLLKGHVLAYAAMKHVFKASTGWVNPQIGIAKHATILRACACNSWKDRLSAWLRNLIFNHLFIKALIDGRVFYPGFLKVKLPQGRTLDYIGLNYYTRSFVHNDGFKVPGIFGNVCPKGEHPEIKWRNSLGWEVYPKGLSYLVKEFSKYKLPIMISENGICTERDEERSQFIQEHLQELARAITWGAPVIGYLHWSLLDNFEWADGFAPRFGLVEVDYKTQTRTVKPSAELYGEICRTGVLSVESKFQEI